MFSYQLPNKLNEGNISLIQFPTSIKQILKSYLVLYHATLPLIYYCTFVCLFSIRHDIVGDSKTISRQ